MAQPERCIVANECYFCPPRPGLGFLLFSAAIAWSYAKRTDRTLIIDWTETIFSEKKEINVFDIFFESNCMLAGVPAITRNLNSLKYPKPIAFYMQSEGLEQYNTVFPYLFRSQKRMADTIPFFGSLRIRPEWNTVIDRFVSAHFQNHFVIGVHVRHGNGEDGHFSFAGRNIKRIDVFLDNFEKYVNEYHSDKNNIKLFVCTDSNIMLEMLASRFSHIITRKQWRPDTNAGCALHCSHLNPRGTESHVIDAFIDMYLLRHCDVPLALTPASARRNNNRSHVGLSGFPIIAAHLNSEFRYLILEDELKESRGYEIFDDSPIQECNFGPADYIGLSPRKRELFIANDPSVLVPSKSWQVGGWMKGRLTRYPVIRTGVGHAINALRGIRGKTHETESIKCESKKGDM